ncbi:MAG: hypothetical protein ABI954_04070 [Pyrinomonadaceae bacterium]
MMKDVPRCRVSDERCIVMPRYRSVKLLICAICGAEAIRAQAKFCAVCGHNLREDYAPLDALRASYNLRKQTTKRSVSQPKPNKVQKLFAEDHNSAASTAMAFVVYSLVPYLGILFCPGALILGGIGLAVSVRKPHLGGRQTATYSLLLGSIILTIQVLLWWLLYIIPELNK